MNESYLNEKRKILATKEEIKTLAAKAELKAEQYKIVKLQTYDLSLVIGQSYNNNDGAQLYLIFQPSCETITHFLVFHSQSQNGNLKDCETKNSNCLIHQIKIFLQNCYGINLD